MIRVLQFANFVNRYDFIDNIVQYADRSKFNISVCVRSSESNIAEPVYGECTPRRTIDGTSRRHIPRATWELARLLKKWEIDILHVHHYDQAVIGWLATRLYPRARLVVGRHYSDALYRLPAGRKRDVFLWLEQLVNRGAARIIVPSRYIFEILAQRQGVNAESIDLIPYGFVPAKYGDVSEEDARRARRELGLEGKFVVGSFGRLHEEKGHRHLLTAVAGLRGRVPGLRVLIVGEGPERARIEQQINSAGLGEVVRLLGWRRDAMTLMKAVDVVAQPTLQEAFSQVMVESLWMRKPLVMTDVSGAPDIIRDRENGLLVPRGDAGALGDAIEKLASDPELRRRLAESGRAYVDEQLVIDKIVPRYEQAYMRAMACRRRAA